VVNLASAGGNLEDGIGIAHSLRNVRRYCGRRIEVRIHEVAASVATLIMCAADSITIADNALLGIHDPLMAETPEIFTRSRDEMIGIYKWMCPKPDSAIAAMMAAVTWMTAQQAVDAGFAHAVKAGPHPPLPFWSDSGFGAYLPADVRASVRPPRTYSIVRQFWGPRPRMTGRLHDLDLLFA
jgi:ATP-dependent protease ClpP protease subunit